MCEQKRCKGMKRGAGGNALPSFLHYEKKEENEREINRSEPKLKALRQEMEEEKNEGGGRRRKKIDRLRRR